MTPDFWKNPIVPHVGDLVTIVNPNVYKERGGYCSKGCALEYYAGSLCEIVSEEEVLNDIMYTLTPVAEIHNPSEKHSNDHDSISDYKWSLMSLEISQSVLNDLSDDFDHVFE